MFRRLLLPSLLLLSVAGCGRTAPYRYAGDAGPVVIEPPPPSDAGIVDPVVCLPLDSDQYNLPPMKRQPIDVLFVVDDSCSMRNDQAALAANFHEFIGAFLENEVDFHLGVVTTDIRKASRSGKLVAPFLTPLTPNLADAFGAMVNVGTNGSGNECGIAAAHEALSEPLLSGTNAGFLRPAADLGLVFLTDENDHSTESVQTFLDFLNALKPDQSQVSVASIVGLVDSSRCNTANWRYVQVAKALGRRGLISSCNQDYAGTLQAVSDSLVAARCIVPLKRPVGNGVKVHATVNGTPSPFFTLEPDSQSPNGSIELWLCPVGGGDVELTFEECHLAP